MSEVHLVIFACFECLFPCSMFHVNVLAQETDREFRRLLISVLRALICFFFNLETLSSTMEIHAALLLNYRFHEC